MVVKKVKTRAKKAQKRGIVRIRHKRSRWSPEERAWHVWNHDIDTFVHNFLQNPVAAGMAPKEIVALAEQFADALHEMQERRRPEGMSDGRF